MQMKLILAGTCVLLCLIGCTNAVSDITRDSPDTLLIETPENNSLKNIHDTISGTCIIELSETNLSAKEYACSTYIFRFRDKEVFVDSNASLTTYYYSLIDTGFKALRLFDYYDSPTGRRKLLVFDTEKRQMFKSDWFDESASGDSIDVKSINMGREYFIVWDKGLERRGVTYKVNLNKQKLSW